jgi:hypothetical protein
MALGPRKFNGKKYAFVGCVDSKTRKNAIISDLKNKGYMHRAVKEGTYRNPIWCIYKRKR